MALHPMGKVDGEIDANTRLLRLSCGGFDNLFQNRLGKKD